MAGVAPICPERGIISDSWPIEKLDLGKVISCGNVAGAWHAVS